MVEDVAIGAGAIAIVIRIVAERRRATGTVSVGAMSVDLLHKMVDHSALPERYLGAELTRMRRNWLAGRIEIARKSAVNRFRVHAFP